MLTVHAPSQCGGGAFVRVGLCSFLHPTGLHEVTVFGIADTTVNVSVGGPGREVRCSGFRACVGTDTFFALGGVWFCSAGSPGGGAFGCFVT